MFEISVAEFSAFLQVIWIDLVLAGDNAIIVGTVAASVPKHQRIKVLVIGMHHVSERAKQEEGELAHQFDVPPTLGEIIGQVMKTLFVDRLDYDVIQLKRINQLIEHLPPAELSAIGFHPVDLLLIRPSVDLGMIANEFESELPLPFRFATRGLGTRETRRADLLATLLFQPGYVNRMIEIGERDGEARRDQIAAFLGR